ncbi:uncharacterized protein TrAtP1_012116 [Trichoderma atroviride]|uniref:Zn(2)-C6 fungal-type domain-containing protein n=1 Tax=Hypocrea atroviridis (strain ATCC 20476 / IMI 206040) TaxID=452589 RepID=G9NNU5_HYPAI|nr:uncharacterized protein TRIATDRAFT_45054 [Trichoderma atroviride IMI 206040]EHK47733.1 hypothetical protein TRIATDRAFT_45054 [Trichoderma atroviride IMI 206040]UKZ71154.1 hypothetical protein TrAtP1_012116 [Trichoderma atroviride]
MTERRRRRTGCLTCRARHVKCDERKPECERCEAGNIECAGYLPKRQVEVRESQRRGRRGRRGQSSSLGNIAPTPPHSLSSDASLPSSTGEVANYPHQLFRSDGLPLVGLPSNPRPSQRPLAGAREVLAYHQFLFRTLPILFPTEHLWFWRDRLCEEGWGIEYLYMMFSALGSMHRAVLMMSMPGDSDQDRGLDTKVIAIQSYTFALQELSRNLEDAKKTQEVFIATIILMAYFECFSSNITAAYSHIRSASYYFELYKTSFSRQKANDTPTLDYLDTALLNLSWMCFMALPLQNKMPSSRQTITVSEEIPVTPTSLRQNLLSILAESGLEDLIWNLVPRYSKSMALAKIYWLQQKLRAWRDANKSILPPLASDMADSTQLNFQEDPFLIPPSLYSTTTLYDASATLCSFLLGRTFWLLSILEDGVNTKTHKRLAYLHFYETLRFAATDGACKAIPPSNRSARCSSPLPCEDLENGILSMLYIIGQCSPEPSWLLWITQLMKHSGRQGLYNGLVYAASLETWHSFEVNNSVLQEELQLRYPEPSSRTISVLIPDANGTEFITYYAKPAEIDDLLMSNDGLMYYLLGDTHLSCRLLDGHIEQNVHVYHHQDLDMELFTPDWLQSQAICLDWQHRSLQVEFDLNRILQDHINGGQFLIPSNTSY